MKSVRITVLCCLFFVLTLTGLAQPVIQAFSPLAAPAGSTITVTGTNFSPSPSGNIVHFGAVQGRVLTASATTLSVEVPAAATYANLSVTVNGLTGYSRLPFVLTFSATIPQLTDQSFQPAAGADSSGNAGGARDFKLADIDGDGKTDEVTIHDSARLTIYRNISANGQIRFAKDFQMFTSFYQNAVEVADMNGDGKLDVLVENNFYGLISVYPNNSTPGNIAFGTPVHLQAIVETGNIGIADLDNDGKPDLFAASSPSPTVLSIFRNTSTTAALSFEPRQDIAIGGSYQYYLAWGDLDGDGKTDLLSPLGYNLDMIRVYQNKSVPGTIAFELVQSIHLGEPILFISLADLNTDGKLDLVASLGVQTNHFTVVSNNSTSGSFQFGPPQQHAVNGTLWDFGVADIDADGKADVLASVVYPGNTPDSLLLIKNTSSTGGPLSFGNNVAMRTAFGSMPVFMGDMDGDARPDMNLISAGYRVFVYKNKTTSPQIISFDPVTGTTGTSVQIQGINLKQVTAVSFGGAPALSFSSNDSTLVTAVVGTGASGKIKITTVTDSASRNGFVYTHAPVVSAFTPQTAATGDTVTITGEYFSNTTAVHFGGVPARWFSIISNFTLKAVVDNGGATGAIRVTSPYGTDSLPGFTYIPVPVLTGFNPGIGGAGYSITLTGRNFVQVNAVSFGGVPAASFTVNNPQQITAVLGAGASGTVKVSSAFGQDSLPGFTYKPAPVITSFSPAQGKTGDKITIKGSGLGSVNYVGFGGVPAASFGIWNDSTIDAYVGVGESGSIRLQSPYGNTEKAGFTYLAAPLPVSFNPQSGKQGDTILITGRYFTGTTKVMFNSQDAGYFRVISDDSLLAVTGWGLSGRIIAQNATGSGETSHDFTFVYPKPSINAFTPSTAGTGTTVVIKGRNFLPLYNYVSFGFSGSVPATYINDSTISAVVGDAASGKLYVSTLGGADSMPGFVYIPPPPQVSSVSPLRGVQGTVISILGQRLTDVTEVTVGGVPVDSFRIYGGGIEAVLGPGASGDVKVTSPYGTGSYSGFYHGPLRIDSIVPNTAAVGATVKIYGTGFIRIREIRINNEQQAGYSIESLNAISMQIPSNARSGFVAVDGYSTGAVFDGLQIISATPVITGASPLLAAKDDTVMIKGSGFVNVSSVSFGTVPALSFTVVDPYTIRAVVAAGKSGDIKVTTGAGSFSFSGFIYAAVPVISGISPVTAFPGNTVKLNGYNFSTAEGSNVVFFGGVKAKVLQSRDNQITVEVPKGATSDFISLYSGGKYAQSPIPFNPTFLGNGPLSAAGFGTAIDSAAGESVLTLAAGDLNNDGRLDIAYSTHRQRFTNIVVNNSIPGEVRIKPRTRLTNNEGPLHQQFKDIDADGRLDLIEAGTKDGSGITVYRNISVGDSVKFDTPVYLPMNSLGDIVFDIADIDLDGKPDIVASIQYAPFITLFRNSSTPGIIQFEAKVNYTTGIDGWANIAVADMNADRKPDIVLVRHNMILVLKSNCTPGNFSFIQQPTLGLQFPVVDFALADMDADGKTDIITTNGSNNTTHIHRNVSSVNSLIFEGPVALYGFNVPYSLAIGDLNGDGKPDLATSMYYDTHVSLYQNNSTPGQLKFSKKADLPSQANPAGLKIADLDNDQVPDLLVASNNSFFSIIPNRHPAVSIDSIAPAFGWQGQTVFIIGRGMDKVTAVSFGNQPAASFRVLGPTRLEVVLGSGNPGTVRLTTPFGILSTDAFTFMRKPQLLSFDPKTATDGYTLTLKGRNLNGVSKVMLGNRKAFSFTVESDSLILVKVKDGNSGYVYIENLLGADSLPGFTYIGPVKLNLFVPSKAHANEEIFLTGTGLDNVRTVEFGGVKASSFKIVSPTSITAVLGQGATGSVKISSLIQSDSLDGFEYIAVTAIVDPQNVNSSHLRILPNPGHDRIIITHPAALRSASLVIYDMSGRILRKIVPAWNGEKTTVNVRNLKNGTYIVVWTNGTVYYSSVLEILQ